MPSRSEHCFAGQRTGFESLSIALEHIHDVFDYFLGETHTPPVDFGRDLTKVGGTRLKLGEERSIPSTECVA